MPSTYKICVIAAKTSRFLGLVWEDHGSMDFLSAINFTVIFQLLTLFLIVVAGPVIVFLLFLRGGDL